MLRNSIDDSKMSFMVPFGLLDYERCCSLIGEELLPVVGEIRTLVPNLFVPFNFWPEMIVCPL